MKPGTSSQRHVFPTEPCLGLPNPLSAKSKIIVFLKKKSINYTIFSWPLPLWLRPGLYSLSPFQRLLHLEISKSFSSGFISFMQFMNLWLRKIIINVRANVFLWNCSLQYHLLERLEKPSSAGGQVNYDTIPRRVAAIQLFLKDFDWSGRISGLVGKKQDAYVIIYQENYVKRNRDHLEERPEGSMATVFLSFLCIFQIL